MDEELRQVNADVVIVLQHNTATRFVLEPCPDLHAWYWRDTLTKQTSQLFFQKRACIAALENGQLEWEE